MQVRRGGAGFTAVILATGLLTAATSPAAAAVPKATSPAARQAPFVTVAHKTLLKAAVKAKAVASFRLMGVADVPTTASAVVLSVTVPTPITSGTLTFYPYGTRRPSVVSLAYATGRTATTTVVVTAGTKGKASLYNAAAKGDKVVVTVIGYYAAPGGTGAANAKTQFVPLPSKHAISVVVGAGKVVALATGVPATRVVGVVLSVTLPSPAKAGSVTLYAHGTKPPAATFAFTAGHPTSSLVVVAPGSKGRVDVVNHSKAAVRVWASVTGYLHTLAVPSAPRSVVGVAQNGGALVTWRPPVSDGGAPVAAYRVEVLPGGTTTVVPGAALQMSVGGLKNGTPYTFLVVAINSAGSSPASAPSAAITPYGVPSAPTNVVAKASDVGTATLTWTAPTDTGGLPITGYKITASVGGATAASTTTSATVSGLASGQYATFTVTATNGPATSLPSAPSGAVLGEGTSRVLPNGTTSGNDENEAAISADGRFVAFDSNAQLTPQDTNTKSDVYLRDRLLGTTTLVSVHTGNTTDGDSYADGISDDGRYVAFESEAHDLVTPATQFQDVYVRDTVAHTTQLVSINNVNEGEASADSSDIVISGDGSTVAFSSKGSDLVGTSNGGKQQVYVEKLASRVVTIASVTGGSLPANQDAYDPTISADGTEVAFCTTATNLTTGYNLYGVSQCYLDTSEGTALETYSDGTHAGNGASDRPALSPDGGSLAFVTTATNLSLLGGNGYGVVYLRSVRSGGLTQVSVGVGNALPSGSSGGPVAVSNDGRYVTYSSDADNLVAGDTGNKRDVFRTDLLSGGVTELISVSNTGALGDGGSNAGAMSPDGLHVAFSSSADNLVGGDTNGYDDLFVRDLGATAPSVPVHPALRDLG
jgi:Fibronectin type III domain